MTRSSVLLPYSACCLLMVACATGLAPHAAAADVPPAAARTPLVKECRGSCTPHLERLDDGNVLLTWQDEKLALWSQRIAADGRQLLGEPTELRDIATAPTPLYQPLTIP